MEDNNYKRPPNEIRVFERSSHTMDLDSDSITIETMPSMSSTQQRQLQLQLQKQEENYDVVRSTVPEHTNTITGSASIHNNDPTTTTTTTTTSPAWWMDFMKEEGLLEDDTHTIFQPDGSIIGAPHAVMKSSTTGSVATSADEAAGLPSTILQNNNHNNNNNTVDDDDDDDSSVQQQDEDDWRERLWVISRNHWNKALPRHAMVNKSKTNNSNNNNESVSDQVEAELLLAQTEMTNEDDDQHILKFRNQLWTCLVAYQNVFGRINMTSTEETTTESKKNTASTGDNPAAAAAATTTKASSSSLRQEASHMSPYVPLHVARRLFTLVLRTMKKKEAAALAAAIAAAEAAEHAQDESSIPQNKGHYRNRHYDDDEDDDYDEDYDDEEHEEDDENGNEEGLMDADNQEQHHDDNYHDDDIDDYEVEDDDFFHLCEHITQVLLSPEANFFRTYMVQAQTNQSNTAAKRIRTDRIANDRQKQRDIERLLYGDMDQEKKQEDEEFEERDPDCPEEEVRIRRSMAKELLFHPDLEDDHSNESDENVMDVLAPTARTVTSPADSTDWCRLFVHHVLLKGLLMDNLSDDPVSVSNFLSARVDKRSETSLAYMYAIRYFPHFYLRASWHAFTRPTKKMSIPRALVDPKESLSLVIQYFGDARLIRNRLVVLGIYNGVMVHVGELDALFQELSTLNSLDETSEWENFYREVHRSIEESLSAVLEENMRSSDFLPSKTAHGIDWKMTEIKDNPSFRIENDHPQIVSVCLEIGRAFHFQGVTLGKREQDRLTKSLEGCEDAMLQKRNFDDRMTELEVDAYLEAQSAFSGALKVLRRAEGAIKEIYNTRMQEAAIRDEDDPMLGPSPNRANRVEPKFDPTQAKQMKHINEARVTIELYLSDTLTTLAYCYEAKLSEYQLALKGYNDSLALYTRHVGKDHPTVLHALQSSGIIHMELKQWKDAYRCFGECLELMKRRLPPGTTPSHTGVITFATMAENMDMALILKCIGVVRSELGDHDPAFDFLSRSIDQMTLTVLQTKGALGSPKPSGIVGPPNDEFICDSLSKMVTVLFAKLASLRTTYARRRLAMLYGDDEDFDIEAIDGPRLTRLQVERRAIEIARDAVNMRKILLFGEEAAGDSVGPGLSIAKAKRKKAKKWFELLELMVDLSNLGKLYFRRCDYDDAIKCWKDALALIDDVSDNLLGNNQLSRAVKTVIMECYEKRLDNLGELMSLIGIASCRLGRNEDGISWFEKALSQLEEKRKIFAEKGAGKGQKGATDEQWDILDMDVGYCEHALGLTYFYSSQLTAATAHYRESLRLFEAVAARRKARQQLQPADHRNLHSKPDQKKMELDISMNSAIAAVMMSLGSLYHEQDKNDRARRFLEGAIQIVYSTTHRILASPKGAVFAIPSVTGFSDLSLIVSVVRVGDAHRRIAMMDSKKNNIEEAKLAFETSMRCLESTNLETRLSLTVDDETHLESVGRSEVEEMLTSCYEQVMTMMNASHDDGSIGGGRGSWWTFGGQKKEDNEGVQTLEGLTREDLLFRLGNISAKRGSFDSAIRCFMEARELTEDQLGTSDHPIIGNILFNLGNVYKKIYNAQAEKSNQKAKERAIEAFVESLRIAKSTSGADSLAAAEVMEALASVLMEVESKNADETIYLDDDGATSFLRDAVAIRNQHRSEMSLAYAQSMHHLGLLRLRHQLQGEHLVPRDDKKLDEAISCLSQSVRIRRVLLGDHLDVANSANCLGVALWKRAISPNGSRHATVNDALKQLSDSLFIRTAFLDRSNQEVLSRVRSKASRHWRKELDGTEDIGSVVMKTVENMYDMAKVHESQRNFEAERTCLNDSLNLLQVWTDRLSSEDEWDELSQSPIAVSELNVWKSKLHHAVGVSWLGTDEFQKAAIDFERSLKFRGLDAIETATSDEVFDNFFRQQVDQPRGRGAGVTPLASAVTMEKLAISYDKLGKFEDALRCYTFCLRVFGVHFGHTSLEVAVVLRCVGKLYQGRHDYKRCVRALQRALHIRDSIDDGEYIPRVEDALVYLQLARSLMALGAYDQVALDHFHSAVGILEDVNQIVLSQTPRQTSIISEKKKSDLPNEGIVDGENTYALLLEGYSSILVLLRRQEEKTPETEENISEVLHHIGNTQAALRQYEKALKSLKRVLEFQRVLKGDDHLSVADLLFNLGNIHVELGQIDQARECHHECHAISSSILGNDSIELAENMMCLGNIEFLDGNYPLALEWFDEALRLLKKKGEYEIAVAKCLHRKAVAHDKLGEYDKSIEYFGEVLRLGRKIWGMNHIELSNILNSVGNVHRNRGEIRRALKCYEESLRIRSRAGAALSIANTKNNIGALFMSMDQTDRARQFYAEALRIKTEVLGSENIETSRTLYNMGQLYVADKQFEKGLRFFEEALRVFEVNFGESHTEVASCLCSIGTVYDEIGEEEQALSFFKKALNAVKGQSGAKGVRASALHNVGIILTKRNDIDNAVRIFREALELKSSDFECEDMSDTQYCLANVLRLTGCIDEAAELHKAALDTRTHYLGPDHVDVANSMFGLAQALVENDNHRDALSLLEECVRIRKKMHGDKSDSVADATFLLGTALREVGSLIEALQCLKAALEVKSKSCGDSSTEVADISFKIAIVLCEMGKYEDAKGYNLKALSIRSSKDPINDSEIADSLENMGIIEQKLGDHERALQSMKKAIEIKETIGGEHDHGIGAIVHTMAQSYFELEKFNEAIRFFEDSVKRKKRSFGPKHIEVARTLVDEGRVFERMGENERALMCYEEAVDSDCYEDDSWELGRVFMRMGITHFTLKKAEDSWDCLAEATRIFELVERKQRRAGRDGGDMPIRTKRDLHDLIKCYECILRLSEASPTRYNIDRSLVLPKVATVLAEIKQYEKACILFQDAIVLQRSLPGDTRFIVATNLHNLGNCLHHQGDFNEALTCLEDALGLFQDIPGVEGKHIADTYHSLAFIHQSRSDMHEALTCYSNALKSRRGEIGENNAAIVSTLVSMGEVLRILGMYDAGIKSCKDALRLLESRGDSRLLMVARIVECIGLTHKDRFEYEKAVRCYKECLKQRRDALGMNHILVGKTLHDMSLIYIMKGQLDLADEGFREAYRIFQLYVGFELPPEMFGDSKTRIVSLKVLSEAITSFFEHGQGEYLVDDAEIIVVLGSIMDQLGMEEEAILCNDHAIAVIDDGVTVDHLLSAIAKHRIGAIFFKRGEYEASIVRLREALQIRRAKIGDNHIDTEDTLKMLSRAHAATGDSEMALFYFKEVMNVRKERSSNKTDSESEADLLLRLGKLHLEQQEYADALTCFKDSLRLQRQSSISRDEQKLGETLQYMGSTLLEIKQYQEARLTLLSALRLLERGQDDSKELMNSTYLLGRVNEEEWSYDKALAWYDRSLAILRKMDKKDDEMNARIVVRIGLIKFAQKHFEEALALVKEGQSLFLSLHGASNLEYADCVHSCGRIHFDMKTYPIAKDCFQKALQVRQQHLKSNDPELGESFHCLGEVLAELEQFEEASSCLVEALRIRLSNFGDSGEVVGETQRCLGTVELHLGKTNQATDHFLEAIRIGIHSVQTRQDMSDDEYDKLIGCFDAVIPMAKNGIYSEKLGKLYHQKGSLQSMHKQFKLALNSFTEAIQVYKGEYGEDHLNVANALFNVGVCLKETGDSERAMKCFARALTITRTQLGEDHMEVADTMQEMAEVYRMKGDLKGAIKMCEQALEIRRHHEDGALAALLNFSGELHTSIDDGDEAERSFRECVRIRKKLHGDDHMDVSDALYSLGYIHETFRKDFRRALRCFEESLRIRINLMEDKNEETAKCYLHLGTVHAGLHADAKAFYCFEKAMMLSKELEDPDGIIVEDAIVGQGHALLARGKAVEALVQYEKARQKRIERSGDNKETSKEIADLRVFEANALEKLGRENEALSRLVQALDMYKETVGMDHLGTGGAFHRLSELYFGMGQHDEALACAQQALTIRKNKLGKHDEATGDSYFVLGKIFFSRMDLDTACPCLEAALEIFRHRRGSNHSSVADSMYYLGCVHAYLKEWDESVSYFQSALPIRQKTLGRDHLSVAQILFHLGISHSKREEYELGADCLSECLRIRTSTMGQEHLLVADTLFELAGTLKEVVVSGKLDPSQAYVDAIRIYRQSLGESHVKVAKCLARLGDILEAKKDTKKAGNCYEKAVAIFESKLNSNPTSDVLRDYNVERDYEAYAEALLDWATFLDHTGNDGSAMKTYRRALVLLQVLRGNDDHVIDSTLCRIANVLSRQGRSGEGLAILEQVKQRRIATVGEDHPLVADIYFSVAQLSETKRDYSMALSQLDSCLRIRRATLGPFTPEVAACITQIGIIEAHMADFNKAIRTWEEALAIYRKAGLPDNDVAVLNVKEHQENAQHMLENLEDDDA